MNNTVDTEEFIYIDFSYKDEFGQISELHNRICASNLDIQEPLPTLVDSFKRFLLAAGFNQDSVDDYIK